MRAVASTIVIRQPIQIVWQQLARPEFLRDFARRLGLWPFQMDYTVVPSRPSEDPEMPHEFGMGDSVLITTQGGRPMARFEVDEFRPPHRLEFVDRDTVSGNESFLMKASFKLDEYGAGRTQVSASFVFFFNSWLLEGVTLVFPARFFYRLFLGRTLKKLAASLR